MTINKPIIEIFKFMNLSYFSLKTGLWSTDFRSFFVASLTQIALSSSFQVLSH
jgi:hypothetical protein